VIGPEGSANVLQLAIQAVTPHRREVEHNFPVESFSLHLPLTLAMTVFETDGTAGAGNRISCPICTRPEATATTPPTSD